MSAAFLILDDNDVFAGTLARSLARRGFRATVAHSGEAALEAARRERFDYATIDLQLEKDSGLQWVSPLRQALQRRLARIGDLLRVLLCGEVAARQAGVIVRRTRNAVEVDLANGHLRTMCTLSPMSTSSSRAASWSI